LKNRGAGQPDIGLLTKDQLKTKRGERKGPPQMPARGIIEAKCTAPDVGLTADVAVDCRCGRRLWPQMVMK
jgi:hypothetical protein